MRKRFGRKVYRISIDGGFTCPNRDGSLSTSGCLYCDSLGSGTGNYSSASISEQVRKGIVHLKKSYGAQKFIAYFQAFSNTYEVPEVLKSKYDQALCDPNIVALAISTRPDCLSDDVIDLLADYNTKIPIWIELGLQSINDDILKKINRHHSTEDFIQSVNRLHDKQLEVCAHVILGLLDDTQEDILKMADLLVSLQIEGVKLHQLYFVKNSQLTDMLTRGQMQAISLEDYINLVVSFLEQLSPDVVVHRLMGDASKDRLIAPLWALNKTLFLEALKQKFNQLGSFQGKKFINNQT